MDIISNLDENTGTVLDPDQLGKSTKEQQTEFTSNKYEVLHFQMTNQGKAYTVNGRAMGRVVGQIDIVMQVHSSINAVTQCGH